MTRYAILCGGYSCGIASIFFDSETGQFSEMKTLVSPEDAPKASWVEPDPERQVVYAVGHADGKDPQSGLVESYAWEAGSLRSLGRQDIQAAGPCHLGLSADNALLLDVSYGSGNARVFPIAADGAVQAASGTFQYSGSGPHKRQDASHAHGVTLLADGRLVVVDLGLDTLFVYRVAGNSVEEVATWKTPAGCGPRHASMHPHLPLLYVACELSNEVLVMGVADGSIQQRIPTLPRAHNDGDTVGEIAINKAGTRCYVSNRGEDSIASFAIDADGQLSVLGHVACGGEHPRHISLTPDEAYLLVSNQFSSQLSALPINGEGICGETSAVAEIGGVSCAQFPVWMQGQS